MLGILERTIGFRVSNPVEPDIGKILQEHGLVRGKVLIVGIDPDEIMVQQFPGCEITVIDPGKKSLKIPVAFKQGYFPKDYTGGKVDLIMIKHLVHLIKEEEAWNILQAADGLSDVFCFSIPGKREQDVMRGEKFAQALIEKNRQVESFELPKDHGGGKLYVVKK